MTLTHGRQLALLALALAALLAAFLRPTVVAPQLTYRNIYVFDISQSMNVADVSDAGAPLTRLELAKRRAIESLNFLPCGAELGVALFTGHRAFLLLAPAEICANYAELETIIKQINWRMTWEARSEVAKGLYKSVGLLTELEEQTRLVFFSDGHEAPPINPDVPPRFTGAPGEVLGIIVGVGGEQAVRIPKFDEHDVQTGFWAAEDVLHVDTFTYSRLPADARDSVAGNEHLSSLRETYLRELADKTGLKYLRLDRTAEFRTALEAPELGITRTAELDIGVWFAAATLAIVVCVLLLDSVASRRRKAPATGTRLAR